MKTAGEIQEQAAKELEEEQFVKEVEKAKERLRRKKPFLHRLLPWRIKLERR